MDAWITSLIDQFGYLAIALLIALENIFPPLPSEIILTMSGFMATKTSLTIVGTIVSATLGSLIGALVLYALGRQLTVQRLGALLKWRPSGCSASRPMTPTGQSAGSTATVPLGSSTVAAFRWSAA